ncbi:hypothetical protein JKP88DRAFT_252357 [Tribonema minus]|uniref:Uncharacterized protein n=1 Tax=Tribonema minus TaxID=303371 RepID=A0A836CLZ9_9STRA|nr:hypothetical protein JKP88DRAFT_252357 [Tribonema minus]
MYDVLNAAIAICRAPLRRKRRRRHVLSISGSSSNQRQLQRSGVMSLGDTILSQHHHSDNAMNAAFKMENDLALFMQIGLQHDLHRSLKEIKTKLQAMLRLQEALRKHTSNRKTAGRILCTMKRKQGRGGERARPGHSGHAREDCGRASQQASGHQAPSRMERSCVNCCQVAQRRAWMKMSMFFMSFFVVVEKWQRQHPNADSEVPEEDREEPEEGSEAEMLC